MASEIRINTLKNRSGLSTVSLTDSGPIFTGIATFTGGVTIPGNLGVGGVLTYEDVTNVDSVGVITARDGLRVTGIATFTDDVRIVKTAGPLLELTTNTGGADATLRLSEGTTGSTTNGGGMFYSGADNKLHITCGTNSTTKRITVLRDDGKVGINTDSPISTLDVKGAIVANGSFYQEQAGQTNGGQAQDKTITFNSKGVILVLISYSLGNTTTDVSRNVYSLGLFTPRSNGATWNEITYDRTSTHVGNLTISDAGSAGALRVQKSAGSDNRACAFRIDVLSNANTQFTITDT